MNTTTPQTEEPKFTAGKWSTDKDYPMMVYCDDLAGSSVGDFRPSEFLLIPRGEEVALGNARLCAAAVNAFISLGERLNLNPVLLAERLEDGGLADVVENLERVVEQYENVRMAENYPTSESLSTQEAKIALSLVRGGVGNPYGAAGTPKA